MRRSLLLAGFIATAAAAAPAPMPPVLRLGYQTAATAPCAAPDASTPKPLAALAQHLARRLTLSVQLCPLADPTAAASALAQGSVDLAQLTPAAWPGVKGKGRPILLLRPEGQLPRTPILAIARTSAGALTAAAIAERRVVLIKQDPLAYDAARATVTTHGGATLANRPTPVAGSFAAAMGALGAGTADVALMPADQWKAGCMADKVRCQAYHVVWHDRPIAQTAWVLRAAEPAELRYRLIGIFMALPFENASAFAGAAGGVRGAFEPTEATALDGAGAER